MAKFLKTLKLRRRSEVKEVLAEIRRIDRLKTPILMEIEQSHVHFRSVLAVKKGVVVVAKPDGLTSHLKKDNVVRFAVPGEEGRDLRLEVISPHFNLTSGNSVFLCKIPEQFAEGAKRKAVRFNTSRFKNLQMFLPSLETQFRIVDLSSHGCKIYVTNINVEAVFPLGVPISPARINISKFSTDLDAVIPRVHVSKAVGFEMTYPPGGAARKYVEHLLTSLLKSEEPRLSSDAL